MTTDGNFNVDHINTVKIPIINSGIVTPGVSGSGFHAYSKTTYFYDAHYFYTGGDNLQGFYKAKITDIFNAYPITDSQPGSFNDIFQTIYPTPIGDYYYNFSTTDAFGGGSGGSIWQAAKNNPLYWMNTGLTTVGNAAQPMVYNDGTNIYLIGGRVSGTAVNTIDVASVSTPTSFSAGATLPAARINGTLVTVGSTIYMYGGVDDTDTVVNTIYSASTSAPDVWTDTGFTLPAERHGMVGYNDGTNVYLFGGTDNAFTAVNDILTAPVGTPTSLTVAGTLPSTATNLSFYTDGTLAYLFGGQGASGIWSTPIGSLLTWSTINLTLSTAVRSGCIAKMGDTIYLYGGFTDSTAISTARSDRIQSAPISNPCYWTDLGSLLPAAQGGGEIIRTKNFLYMIGGQASGNYYRAPIATPTVWTLAGTDGPTTPNGRAVISGSQLYYMGGDFSASTGSPNIIATTIDSSSSPSGGLGAWVSNGAPYHTMALPTPLRRFSVIVAGKYIYVLGGVGSSAVMNFNIYRNNMDSINTGWINIGTINNPTVDATTVVINNYVYILGGGPNGTLNTSSTYTLSCSMTDLANGNGVFVEENGSSFIGSESHATTVGDDVYFFGGRSVATPITSIERTSLSADYALISPRVPEAIHSIPAVDLQSGALGSLTSFQRTGMLPWLITDI